MFNKDQREERCKCIALLIFVMYWKIIGSSRDHDFPTLIGKCPSLFGWLRTRWDSNLRHRISSTHALILWAKGPTGSPLDLWSLRRWSHVLFLIWLILDLGHNTNYNTKKADIYIGLADSSESALFLVVIVTLLQLLHISMAITYWWKQYEKVVICSIVVENKPWLYYWKSFFVSPF